MLHGLAFKVCRTTGSTSQRVFPLLTHASFSSTHFSSSNCSCPPTPVQKSCITLFCYSAHLRHAQVVLDTRHRSGSRRWCCKYIAAVVLWDLRKQASAFTFTFHSFQLNNIRLEWDMRRAAEKKNGRRCVTLQCLETSTATGKLCNKVNSQEKTPLAHKRRQSSSDSSS